MNLITVVIPVSPKHHAMRLYEHAERSARNQTIPCDVIVQVDTEGRGAAWARNQAMRKVKTDFVVFLDADDTLDRMFVEQALALWHPGYYVYSDWRVVDRAGERIALAPDRLEPLTRGQQHITATLLPVAAYNMAGGFDESLRVLEDEDFYIKVHLAGWCGVRCPYPLVTYNRKHGDSLINPQANDLDTIAERMKELERFFKDRYRGAIMPCNCVKPGDSTRAVNEPGENTILVYANYVPQTRVGRATGKRYPRTGHGRTLHVDAADAAAAPEWWQPVESAAVKASPDKARVEALLLERKQTAQGARPNFERVLKLAGAE